MYSIAGNFWCHVALVYTGGLSLHYIIATAECPLASITHFCHCFSTQILVIHTIVEIFCSSKCLVGKITSNMICTTQSFCYLYFFSFTLQFVVCSVFSKKEKMTTTTKIQYLLCNYFHKSSWVGSWAGDEGGCYNKIS